MTQEEFKQTVDEVKKVIPKVYDQVKEKSDTFFIDEMLGPSYTTANLQETSYQQMPQDSSNRDLISLLDNTLENSKMQQSPRQPFNSGHGGVVVGKGSLSKDVSMKSLNNTASHTKLIHTSVGT